MLHYLYALVKTHLKFIINQLSGIEFIFRNWIIFTANLKTKGYVIKND